ncbi:lantibiotic immunity ABC transporter MutG family permease subunit [Clostridium sp.]|jgi:ABC-2 type transport system permease protein|uniref:lantibiotic immunity ABC transporter MutG family permease subunit n=1 Tax=Clostridium sp. TaxID=1506 RepID=UPI0025870888|nr:lantibiotic immunity ABC transporter MutG family permease subunit [Clostridium sp.]MDF2505548.1 lantibiotic protection transporter permease subunit, MutG family [Clostridium sp.]
MIKILSAEWIKIKRTPIKWASFLTPVIYAILIIWYYSLKTINSDTQISIFETFFQVWTIIFIPIGAGLFSGFMIYQEELAGRFNGLLISKLSRLKLYLAKLIILILLTIVSILIATFILVIGLNYIVHISVSIPIFILAAIVAGVSAIPLLSFHLWISFAWGMGASIGIGGGGLLIAALMATNLGNTVWEYIPWAWPIRISTLPGLYLLNLADSAFNYAAEETTIGMVCALIFFIIMLAGGILWFKKWEGRKMYH